MTAPTIAHVEVFPVGLRMIRTFVFASGSAGRSDGTAPHVFVKLTDSDGRVGWGEGRPSPGWSYETPESVTSTIESYLGPAIIGVPTTDRYGLHQRMNRVIGRGTSTGMPVAKAALDLAIHDLAARHADQSLRAYLGGADERRGVELSYTVTAHTESDVAEDVARGHQSGIRHFNYKVAVHPETDVRVGAQLRRLAGTDAFISADANQALSLVDAVRLAEQLRDVGVDLLEQPLPADAFDALGALRARTSLPLAVDESAISPTDFFRHAAAGLVDYLVIKLSRSGGLWPSTQQAAVAGAAGLGVILSSLTDSLLAKVAACQLAAAVGSTGPAALNGSQFIDEAAVYPGKDEVERGGSVILPDAPGIGVAPDEDELRKRLLRNLR